ncbi:MAG: hypothetical protein QG582_1075 [Candidatus Thermoplasmatota archaeon]|nr:hypothetical protein [Candidatus Thermoplasmatota archaeon]
MASEDFDALNDEMVRELFRLNPDAGTRFGMHDPYDGMLPHGGFRRVEDTSTHLTSWLRKAERVAASEELDDDQQTSLEVLRMSEALQRFAVDDYPQGRMSPEAVEAPGGAMLLMLTRDYATPEKKAEWASSKVGEIPRYLEQFRTRFTPGRPVKHWTRMSIESAEGLPAFLEFLEDHFKKDATARLAADLSKNVARAHEAVNEHVDWLKNLEERAVPEFAMGPDNLAKLLKIRGFPLTPDQVLAFGEASLKSLRAERAETESRMAPGLGPGAAVAIMKDDSPATFDDAFAEAALEVERAKRFMVENDIATVDYDAKLHIVETPSFMASAVPTAALEMAAPFEERQQGILMLTRASGEALRDVYSRAAIANLATHEAYPGHFHQGVVSNKKPWMHQLSLMLIEPDTMVPSWETQEGWAMYCEKMMMDRGFRSSLADRHAMLDFAIWRACRIIYDVRLARGETSLEKAIRLFMKETNSSRKVARDDVFGFVKTPGYGLSYLTGRQMVLDLKADLVKKLGGGFNEKRFHDLLATNGNLPFHLARRAVTRGLGLAPA